MIKKYKMQITNSLIYTFSTIVSKAVPFLLLPLFTAYLSKKDYGILGLISAIFSISSIFVGLRPSLFIIVKGSQLDKKEVAKYIYNICFVTLYSAIIVGIVLIIVRHAFFNELSIYIFILITFMGFLSVFNELLETIFQIEKKAYCYFIYQLSKTTLSASLVLLLIIFFGMGWEGKFFADFLVILAFSIFALYYLIRKRYIVINYDIDKQIYLFKYLSPLTLHVLGLVLMGSIDRVFISNMIGFEATGLYSIGYTIGALLGVIHDALLKVWSPEFYKKMKDATVKTKIKILKFIYLYILGSFLMYGVFVWVAPFIFNIMVNIKFHEAYPIVPIVALGLTFESVRKLFIGYHYNLGKNYRIAFITISAGILNAIMNYILIPKYGIDGAAYATLIAYTIVAIITIIDVNKFEKIPWLLKMEVK